MPDPIPVVNSTGSEIPHIIGFWVLYLNYKFGRLKESRVSGLVTQMTVFLKIISGLVRFACSTHFMLV